MVSEKKATQERLTCLLGEPKGLKKEPGGSLRRVPESPCLARSAAEGALQLHLDLPDIGAVLAVEPLELGAGRRILGDRPVATGRHRPQGVVVAAAVRVAARDRRREGRRPEVDRRSQHAPERTAVVVRDVRVGHIRGAWRVRDRALHADGAAAAQGPSRAQQAATAGSVDRVGHAHRSLPVEAAAPRRVARDGRYEVGEVAGADTRCRRPGREDPPS